MVKCEGLEHMRKVAAKLPDDQGSLNLRFAALAAAVKPVAKPSGRRTHSDQHGRHYATIESDRFGTVCRSPKTVEPAFVEFCWARLPELRAEFESKQRNRQ
jgi:hypothetical protein